MRRVRILVLAVILIAIVCAGVSLYAYQHNKRAEENTIDIIKDFTGKEEVDVSGQSRKPGLWDISLIIFLLKESEEMAL